MRGDPIAYTYDADWHCPDCAIARFGLEPGGRWPRDDARDSEGNEVGAVAPWTEWWNLDGECEVLACSDCHEVIANAHRVECEYQGGEEPCDIREEYRV